MKYECTVCNDSGWHWDQDLDPPEPCRCYACEAPARHEAVASPIDGGWSGYRATCECGWLGPQRMAKIHARADAGDHNLRERAT